MVALHNFKGGYCGVSQVENGNLNVCYIATYNSFQKYKNMETFKEEVLFKNRHLKQVFENSVEVFEQPLTISQISFSDKSPVENHMLMCGDAAGMIHPLCGNGMAMAIHSAKIVSELIIGYFNSQNLSRQQLESAYTRLWNAEFKKRIVTGRILQKFFGREQPDQVNHVWYYTYPGCITAHHQTDSWQTFKRNRTMNVISSKIN